MANRFLAPDEVAREMLRIADDTIAQATPEVVERFSQIEKFTPGIGGAILMTLVLAARKRLNQCPGNPQTQPDTPARPTPLPSGGSGAASPTPS